MPPSLARSVLEARAARVEPRSLTLRVGQGEERVVLAQGDALEPGLRRPGEGPIEVNLGRTAHGTATTLELELFHCGDQPVFVESVSVGLCWMGHGAHSHRFLRHGWQSWSFTGYRDLDSSGEPAFPSGPWLRGMHHCVDAPASEWAGWHESATFGLVGRPDGGDCCLAGVLESGRNFGVVHFRPLLSEASDSERPIEIEVEVRIETILNPGDRRSLEAIRVAAGREPNELLERFANLWGHRAGARTRAASPSGWCSWYHYFHRITERDLLSNLEALQSHRDSIPVAVVQLDDGYQRAVGDWLETNERFPGGLEGVARAIRDAGFEAGLWTAPFAASAESELLRNHPDWALIDERAEGETRWLRGTFNPEWSQDGWVYALDSSHPELLAHLEKVFRTLKGLGFSYQKLDFLYMAAMRGRASDPGVTRAERLRSGLEAIRRGAGEESFLLGCGSPLGPAVGWVDGMRIGPDVAPSWEVDQPHIIPGLEPALPSTRSALRSVAARLFMHRRLWLNDPDCLMARTEDTKLREDEARSLAAAIGISGGMRVFSDDVARLGPAGRRLVAAVEDQGRRVDGSRPGSTRLLNPLASSSLLTMEAWLGPDFESAQINLGDESNRLWPLPTSRETGQIHLLTELSATETRVDASELRPHTSSVVRGENVRRLSVFCDFDGTFSMTDVGSTIAQRWLSERRMELGMRYGSGEIDAWEYAELLFNGFSFGPEKLDAFLRGVALDPGAQALLDWCSARSIPFRILSDGFDYNLKALQEIHGVEFDFVANRLRIRDGAWQIDPGHRNPACDCGTGVCKRAILDARRAEAPLDCLVHIGNGRVSDRCGAEAADIVFAKETLAEDLAARGVAFVAFESLFDVLDSLEAEWGPGIAGDAA